jgi:flagellar motor switch protein FliN/FliY
MPEDLQYETLEARGDTTDPAVAGREGDLRRLREVPVNLAVEIGRARMTVGQTLALRPGSIVTLDRLAEEPVDLLVNGTRIARGEVVVIDEDFGLRITEVQTSDGGIASAGLSGVGQLSVPSPVAQPALEAEQPPAADSATANAA